nr:unnamed protein product [Callosobruchus chinensis]
MAVRSLTDARSRLLDSLIWLHWIKLERIICWPISSLSSGHSMSFSERSIDRIVKFIIGNFKLKLFLLIYRKCKYTILI